MPWYIVNPGGIKFEAFRTRTEASHHLSYYVKGYRVEFYPSTKLQAVRIASGLSQKDLATLAEVSLNTLQKWEQGSKNINRAAVEDILKISKVLRCRIEDLLE